MLERIRTTNIPGIEPSPIKCYTFEWSSLALGWYESLLWGFIFVSEMPMGRGTVGLWNGTHVKLFRVQETGREGPSLRDPKGAVDAVATTLIDRLSSVNLSALGEQAGAAAAAVRGAATGAGRQGPGAEGGGQGGGGSGVRSAVI